VPDVAAAGRWITARLPGTRARATVEIVGELVREVRSDRVTGLAAEVAFFGVLSLFPGFIAVAAAVGSLEVLIGDEAATDVQETVVSFLERVLTSEAADTVAAVRDLFEDRSAGLLTVGLVGAVWAMSRGFTAVMNALDVVYDLEERRSYVHQRVLSLVFALSTVVVVSILLAMVVVGPLLGTGRDVADAIGLGEGFATFWTVLRWPVMLLVLVAWATALFHFAPNHRSRWTRDLPGAALAAAAWIAVTIGFRAYLAVAGSANQVLGALGGALIVLVWLYLLGLGLLVGGELNAILAVRRGGTSGGTRPVPSARPPLARPAPPPR